jgi:hypothetical protein
MDHILADAALLLSQALEEKNPALVQWAITLLGNRPAVATSP